MSVEVVKPKEEADTPGVLVSDDRGLTLAVCTSQEQACLGTRWTNHHPALRATIGSDGWRVVYQLEFEHVDEEPNGPVIVINHNCYKLKKGH
jgi:hypothetical protein